MTTLGDATPVSGNNRIMEGQHAETPGNLEGVDMIRRILIAMVLACWSLNATAQVDAAAAEANAAEIIQRMQDLYRGESSRAEMSMIVETPDYKRTMTMSSVSRGTEDMLIRILSPRKDRGITTLKREQEMWNFFPKINKVIKVPPSMMMGSWMGSDFTNDDIVQDTELVDKYALDLAVEEPNYVVTLMPREQTVTVWGKIVYVINATTLLPVEQSFFDDRGEKVRVMRFLEPRDFGGTMLPSVMELVPLNKPGHKTIVRYDMLEQDADDVAESLFTLRNLKKRF